MRSRRRPRASRGRPRATRPAAAPPRPRGEVELRRLGVRAPRLALVGELRGYRLGVEQDGREVDARDAVDERVVRLGDQCEAVALEPLDQPRLPQRLRAVELL